MTPDDARKLEKPINDVKLWRALMASPLIVSGRAFWCGLTGGVALTRAGLAGERWLAGRKPGVRVDTVERERELSDMGEEGFTWSDN